MAVLKPGNELPNDTIPKVTKRKETAMYEIIHDGGALSNQDSANRRAYGSMAARYNGKPVEITVDMKKYRQFQVRFTDETNNQAEYKIFILALIYAIQLLGRMTSEQLNQMGKIRFRTDSKLLVDQMTGKARCKSPALKELHDQARALFTLFPDVFELEWMDNREVKAILGH